jgi:hypothetical protein
MADVPQIYDNIPARFVHIKTFEAQWRAYLRLRDQYRGWCLSSLLEWTVAPPLPLSVSNLLEMLPPQSDCDVLVRRFLDTFNRIYPIVDGDALLREMSDFWQSKTPLSNTWVAYALAVIANGLLVPVHALPDDTEVFQGRVTGRRLMTAAMQFVMSTPLLFRRPDSRVFQTLLLSILSRKLDLSEPDAGDGINGSLAIARQMAFAMGLHRDPSSDTKMTDQVVSTKSTIGEDANLRRKVSLRA